MHKLAGLFVSLVTLANTLAPSANLPKVLGVEVTNETHTATGSSDLKNNILRERELMKNEAASSAAQFRLKISAERQAFQDKLKTIKDERKQTVVENLDKGIAQRNTNWVNHWNEVIKRLTDMSGKIKSRADKAAANGKDVSAVTSALNAANTAIADAQAAINAQATKTYTFNITTDANLGQNVKTTIHQFETDVKAIIEKLNTARKDLVEALRALKGIGGVDNFDEKHSPKPSATPISTSSPSASPVTSPSI